MTKLKALMSGVDMTTGAPWKKLLAFTVPLLIGNLFQQLYGLVDAIMLGNWVGVEALAAVTATLPIFFLIMVFMMGVAMGAGVMVSQYYGAKKREELSRTIGASITLTIILGVLVASLGPLGTRWLLTTLETPPEVLDYAVLYINVLLWGVLGMGFFNIFSGILRGVGDAFWPLVFLIFSSLLSILLNFIFIRVLELGVTGAAVSTVTAQTVSALLCLAQMKQKRDAFDMKWAYLWPRKTFVKQILRLGVPTGASQAVFAVAMMLVQPLVNGFGMVVMAANNIVMKVDGLVMMPNFSYGNAMTVYAGQNMGANQPDRVAAGTKQGVCLAVGTAAVLITILLIFGRQIAGWFVPEEFEYVHELLDLSVRFLRILAAGYLIFSVNMVLWGTIRGAGDAMTPLWAAGGVDFVAATGLDNDYDFCCDIVPHW
ncbi:MAG: MATE family efflux transporter [Defluviitaleaceae bacterium]|nr:MATE family efflux transporter [Defluviitaleaceae bacterium]